MNLFDALLVVNVICITPEVVFVTLFLDIL